MDKRPPIDAQFDKAVGAVVLLREDGAALLQHRDNKPGLSRAGMWVMPGGHCDPDESMETCAERELFEETGYKCDKLHWLAQIIDDEDLDEGHAPYPLTIFWTLYDGVQELHCFEGQELKFVKRDLASSYAMPKCLIDIWDLALEAFAEKIS